MEYPGNSNDLKLALAGIHRFDSYGYDSTSAERKQRRRDIASMKPHCYSPPGLPNPLVEAARDSARVQGLTHEFYRYPARFSPTFVRAAIEAYSAPGDWVIDPFVGGGTTLVEAMALGRNALGVDISSLSTFICDAKTQILSEKEFAAFDRWKAKLAAAINTHRPSKRAESYAQAGYYRNLDDATFWRIRKAIEQSLELVERIRLNGAQVLARCVVLKTAQWALDSRKTLPSVQQFRDKIVSEADLMGSAARAFSDQLNALGPNARPCVKSLNRSTAGLETDEFVRSVGPPRLIVTSPPYPGIHVLYHRWQVDGRREAPAPFWIAGKLDGAGSSYYTLGDRKNPGLRTYFENLRAAFSSIAALADERTTIVQMVAFSECEWQLPKYLAVMEECGLAEETPWQLQIDEGRLWREVPNRRWHAHQKMRSPGAREVVLVHRKRS